MSTRNDRISLLDAQSRRSASVSPEARRVSSLTPPREPSLKPSARPSARASTRPTSSFDLDEELWFGLSDEVGKEEAKRSLAATVARELGVRAAPTTVAAIGALDLDTAPVDDIIKVFEADPALAARVLSVVNSAGYALSYRCRSIRHAVVMLGVRAVASLATASSFMDFLTHDSEVSEALTAHAHDVAVLSAHLAFLSGESREQAYAIGLLHDIGRSMLLQSEEQRYQPLGALTDESNVAEREREEFGFDHAMLGSTVLRAWQIPDPIPTIVAYHHAPQRLYAKGGREAALVCILRLADRLAPALRAYHEPDPEAVAAVIAEPSHDILGLDAKQVSAAWTSLRAVVLEERSPGDGPIRTLAPAAQKPEDEAPPSATIVEAPARLLCTKCAQPTLGDECPACKRALCRDHLPDNAVCEACEAAVTAARHDDRWLQGLFRATVGASGGLLVVLASLLVVRLIGRVSSLLEMAFFVLAAAMVVFGVNAAFRAFHVRMRALGRQGGRSDVAPRPSLIVNASETPPNMNLREDEIATAVERQVFRATAIGNLMEKVRSLSPPAPRDPSIPPSAGVPLVRGIFGEPGMPISITMPPQSGSPSNAPSERPKARRTRKPPAGDLATTAATTDTATTDGASAPTDVSAAKPKRRAKTKTAPPSEGVVTSAPTPSEKPKSRPRKSRAAAPPEAPPDSAVTRIGSTLPEGALEDEGPKRSRRPRKAM